LVFGRAKLVPPFQACSIHATGVGTGRRGPHSARWPRASRTERARARLRPNKWHLTRRSPRARPRVVLVRDRCSGREGVLSRVDGFDPVQENRGPSGRYPSILQAGFAQRAAPV
jgi:hypothetical protein